jgi:hypothetical protein
MGKCRELGDDNVWEAELIARGKKFGQLWLTRKHPSRSKAPEIVRGKYGMGIMMVQA